MVNHLTKKPNNIRKSALRNKTIYPDGEAVHYGYDYGGNVTSITGRNRGEQFPYVRQIGYDEWGQRIYLQLGNGVETSLEI